MIADWCKVLEFPTEAADCVSSAYDKIIKHPASKTLLERAENSFVVVNDAEYATCLDEISQNTGIHRYTVDLTFLLTLLPKLRKVYDERGISEDIFVDTVRDITAKLYECKKLYGIWGTSVVWWYKGFFRAERFALGRFQYEKIAFPHEQYKDILKNGDVVYNFHVPSMGVFNKETMLDSFARAYKFYENDLDGKIMPIILKSWLIYPPTASLYKENSNLKAFYDCFDIIAEIPDEKNRDAWRVFYTPTLPEELDTLPEETSLQRSLKSFLKQGGIMGSGHGIILFDGEKII